MLQENGVIADDGIVARLGEQRFWVNTTSAMAEHTAASFEEWLQCEFTSLKVLVTPVTSRWANLTVAGPKAWDWLAAAGFEPRLAPSRMRHMSIADSSLDGMPLRALRASFNGELSYELNVPADEATATFERLAKLAPRFDAAPYGLEALQILRVEKGYIVIGSDTDGTTFPGDVGHGRSLKNKAANFIGRRSLSLPVAQDADRLQLVGVEPLDRKTRLPVGAHIAAADPPTKSEGHITSSVLSVALDRPIALAMLSGGSTRLGERIKVHHLGQSFPAEVVAASFVDPEGARLNG
jgi:sarcosine oxidase subunit alpha